MVREDLVLDLSTLVERVVHVSGSVPQTVREFPIRSHHLNLWLSPRGVEEMIGRARTLCESCLPRPRRDAYGGRPRIAKPLSDSRAAGSLEPDKLHFWGAE